MFDESTSWSSLKNEYIKFKESLIQKYGTPYKDLHYFDYPYDNGDEVGHEMTALHISKCHYACFWNNGIGMAIFKSGQVGIAYTDPINEELYDKEENTLINNDL